MLSSIVFYRNSNRAFAAVIADALSVHAALTKRLSVERYHSDSSLERCDEEKFTRARLVTSFCRTNCYLKAFVRRRDAYARAAINTTFIIWTRPVIFIKSRLGSSRCVRVN